MTDGRKFMSFAAVFVLLCALGNEAALVQTPKGILRGTTMTSRNGREFHAFRGVRYALPPVGELRFKPPVGITESWSDVTNATSDGASCPQSAEFLNGTFSEDCLFLNVYTPKIPSEESDVRYPVLFFIHHGGWHMLSGQSSLIGPRYLLDEDIVLVTINYRLGALGFLSTGDSVAPGNNGLKDQVAALEWVRDNIANFGGDPNSVTIYGYSAGSASVQYHLVSPLSAGLFHRAISGSGSALSRWAIIKDPMATAKKTAKALNCPYDVPSETMIDCLRGKGAEEIAKSHSLLKEWAFEPTVLYAPVIEPSGTTAAPFLTADPEILFRSGNFSQVPWMTGTTDNEHMTRANRILNNQTMVDDLNENFSRIVPIALKYERNGPESARKSQRIRDFYFKSNLITKDSLQSLTDMYTDASFLEPVDRSVNIISKISKSPVFYYQFTYCGRFGHMPKEAHEERPRGAVHHDDLIYLFHGEGERFPFFTSDYPEFSISKRMVKLWTNFVKTGNPTEDSNAAKDSVLQTSWEPFTPSNPSYMEIGSDLIMKNSLRQKRVAFWQEIFPLKA